jgi:hypothetical protein
MAWPENSMRPVTREGSGDERNVFAKDSAGDEGGREEAGSVSK